MDVRNAMKDFKSFSSLDVLNGKLTEKDVNGKIVILGFLGPGSQDRFRNPYPNERQYIYGVEYLANIVAQVLEE